MMRRTPGTPGERLALLCGVVETSLPHVVADVLYLCRNHRNVLMVDGPGGHALCAIVVDESWVLFARSARHPPSRLDRP
jgi:hypothetical protein